MRAIILAIPLLLLTAAAQARDLKAEITAVNNKFGVAYEKGDATAIARLYTSQATILPPGQPMVTGRPGIQKIWGAMIHSGMKLTSLKVVAVEPYGSAAREIGVFTAEVPNAEKKMTKMSGKYVVVWKQVNGAWMLDSDIWNMDQ